MKKTVLLLTYLLCSGRSWCQSWPGLTLLPDTSFSTYSAYKKIAAKFPESSIVTEDSTAPVARVKNITYCTVGNRPLVLDVFYPANRRNINGIAVLMVHGGGWRSGNRMQHYAMATALAAKGYTCFLPEYRLSTEALFPAAVYDLKAAVRWVRNNALTYHIDTAQLVIAGFSAGGELAAFIGTTGHLPLWEGHDCNTGISSQVNAVIDIDGTLSFVHPESREGDDSKKISAATNWFGYPKKENPALWETASPLHYAGSHTPPTLFINSAVPAMHAGREEYILLLKQHGIYTEVHSFEEAPHTFCLFTPWFEPTIRYMDQFLQQLFSRKAAQ